MTHARARRPWGHRRGPAAWQWQRRPSEASPAAMARGRTPARGRALAAKPAACARPTQPPRLCRSPPAAPPPHGPAPPYPVVASVSARLGVSVCASRRGGVVCTRRRGAVEAAAGGAAAAPRLSRVRAPSRGCRRPMEREPLTTAGRGKGRGVSKTTPRRGGGVDRRSTGAVRRPRRRRRRRRRQLRHGIRKTVGARAPRRGSPRIVRTAARGAVATRRATPEVGETPTALRP